MLNIVPPITKIISLKKGERLMATIEPSRIDEYHSALDALINVLIRIFLLYNIPLKIASVIYSNIWIRRVKNMIF
jgi:hypothetical protein